MPVGTDSIYKSQNGVLYSSSTQYLSNLFLNAVTVSVSIISAGSAFQSFTILLEHTLALSNLEECCKSYVDVPFWISLTF